MADNHGWVTTGFLAKTAGMKHDHMHNLLTDFAVDESPRYDDDGNELWSPETIDALRQYLNPGLFQ